MGCSDTYPGALAAIAAVALCGICLAIAAPQVRADAFQGPGLSDANELAISPASAYPPGGPAMNAARAIAENYWHGEPCHGDVKISWASMGSSVNAIATWSNRAGAYADPAHNVRCSVRFNSDQAFDWPALCTVFTHEFGHLTGHQHSADPNDVMYPLYSVPLAACADTPSPPVGPSPAAAASRVARRRAVGARHAAGRHHARRERRHKRGRRARGR